MRTITILTFLIGLTLGVNIMAAQDEPAADTNQVSLIVSDPEIIALTSTTNGHDYIISVALPPDYDDSEAAYPVLYLLDPQVSFLSVVEFVRWLGHWNELPDLIVVGIGYPIDDMDELFALRERDYYLSQDEFSEFISEELFPFIDSTYRTDSTDRALVGFSYGGEFVFHILVNSPELFNRYIAIDSGTQEIVSVLLRDDPTFREKLAELDVNLFYSSTGSEVLSGAIQAKEYDGLEVTGLSLGNVTHGAALHLSLPTGIMAIYED
jgi:predicted alpha/beta superfamily hydrolase